MRRTRRRDAMPDPLSAPCGCKWIVAWLRRDGNKVSILAPHVPQEKGDPPFVFTGGARLPTPHGEPTRYVQRGLPVVPHKRPRRRKRDEEIRLAVSEDWDTTDEPKSADAPEPVVVPASLPGGLDRFGAFGKDCDLVPFCP